MEFVTIGQCVKHVKSGIIYDVVGDTVKHFQITDPATGEKVTVASPAAICIDPTEKDLYDEPKTATIWIGLLEPVEVPSGTGGTLEEEFALFQSTFA